jgi:formate dehydrogenase beta subunit
VDEPIAIRALKRFVADHELSVDKKPEYFVVPSDRTGRVAVVGAGPAGITCAYHLARKGHQVTIYERWAEPGGMSAMGIPDYRLPRSVLNREVDWIQRMGVTMLFRQTVGEEVSLSQLEGEFDAVFIGIGAQQSAALGIQGEREGHQGLVHGLQYLREIKEGRDPHPEGRRVAVIGGGNVAIDCARSSFRVHKKEVDVVYRRGRHEMPADDEEIRDAEAEGVRLHFLTSPIQVLATDGHVTGLRCIRMTLGEPDHSGRPRPLPVEGSEFVLQCDTVVPAVGQRIDPGFLDGAEGLEVTGWNGIVVDPDTKQAHRPKIFSAGDCETGPDSLIAACAGGRQAARNIDRFINGLPLLESDEENCFDRLFESLRVYDPEERIAKVEARERKHPPKLPVETRVSSFEEVEQVFSGPEAIAEAERCLRCYYVVTVAV